MAYVRYTRMEFLTRLFGTNSNLRLVDHSVICDAENVTFLHESLASWLHPLSAFPFIRGKKKHTAINATPVCVCDMEQNQTALADKHTDIHKNQYSSTTSTAAALIKLPDEYRRFCVHACLWMRHFMGE